MADVTDNGPTSGEQPDPAKPDFAQLEPPAPEETEPAAGQATPPVAESPSEAGEADDTERADGAVIDAGNADAGDSDAGHSEAQDSEVETDAEGAPGEADPAAAAGRKPKRAARHGHEGHAAEDEADAEDSGPADADVPLGALEALLLGTHHPLTAPRLAELLQLKSIRPIRGAVKLLNEQYESAGRSFRIEQVAGGYQILTLPEYGEVLKKLHQKEADARLTKAALETLSIIAYKQPILRADVEAIRGVACGETIRSLMEKHLVKIAGRAEEPGRPILYGTTRRFLELFGLNSLKDLPQPEGTPKPPGGA